LSESRAAEVELATIMLRKLQRNGLHLLFIVNR
jgi:hypothetical protein